MDIPDGRRHGTWASKIDEMSIDLIGVELLIWRVSEWHTERVRSAARRVEDFFDNLFGNRSGPGTPGFPTPPPGAPGADGPPSPDDMVNRRNVDRGVPRSGDHVPSWMNPSSTGKPNINTETNEVVVTDQKKPKVWTVQDSRWSFKDDFLRNKVWHHDQQQYLLSSFIMTWHHLILMGCSRCVVVVEYSVTGMIIVLLIMF